MSAAGEFFRAGLDVSADAPAIFGPASARVETRATVAGTRASRSWTLRLTQSADDLYDGGEVFLTQPQLAAVLRLLISQGVAVL